VPDLLYHYTCDHGERDIRADGALRGNQHPLMPGVGPIIWLTDMEVPDAHALGLTMRILLCDRTAYRFSVRTDRARHWPTVARELCSPAVRRHLDLAAGARPMHWWVATGLDMIPVLTGGESRG
jgi:hypothetical protein